MKLLFIFPPGKGFGIAAKKILPDYTYSPPLGILYLSKMLENKDHDVEVMDYRAENVDETKLRKKISSSDAVGMTIYTESSPQSMDLAHFIKECDKDTPLLIGGPHCTLVPKQSLIDFNADICVRGGRGINHN